MTKSRVPSFLSCLAPLALVAGLCLAPASTQAAEVSRWVVSVDDEGGGCDDNGWPEGGGGWGDWMDMIGETGCIPSDYDYYMLPDGNPPWSGPSTVDEYPDWAPGEDGPVYAPDRCDFYDSVRDEEIYFFWGCG